MTHCRYYTRLPVSRHFFSVSRLLAIIFFIGLFRHRGVSIFNTFESLKKWWEERNVIYFGKALRRKIERKKESNPKHILMGS